MDGPNLSHLPDVLPLGLGVAFILTTLAAVGWWWWAVRQVAPRLAPAVGMGLLGWLAVQAALAAAGFYLEVAARPPRLLVAGILPTALLLLGVFGTSRGRRFADALPLGPLTYLHVVRVPVELVLYGLFLVRQVPELMTFAGRNPDMLAGLTAPLVAYWAYTRPRMPRVGLLLLWHAVALALLLNIVGWAVLASPVPFQQVAFEQPNVAILKWPVVWLPTVVVPLVLFSHVAALRQLARAWRAGPRLAARL